VKLIQNFFFYQEHFHPWKKRQKNGSSFLSVLLIVAYFRDLTIAASFFDLQKLRYYMKLELNWISSIFKTEWPHLFTHSFSVKFWKCICWLYWHMTIKMMKVLPKRNAFWKYIQICVQRPPKWIQNCGRCWQAVVVQCTSLCCKI